MSKELYHPPELISSRAHIASMDQYREIYARSINNPEEFWAEQANQFCWFEKWDQVRSYNYDVTQGAIKIE